MSSIFPIREKVSLDREPEPRLVDLDEETADEVFEALASTTTRKIFLELHNQPQTASDLADVTDTSVQNVQYHLEKLTESDLVEVVDTWYSERGSEMKVYAPTDDSLVLFAGRDKQSAFRRLVNRFAGALAILLPPSILAGYLANWRDGSSQEAVRTEFAGESDGGSESGGDAAFGAEEPDSAEESADLQTNSADDGSGDSGTGVEDAPEEDAADSGGSEADGDAGGGDGSAGSDGGSAVEDQGQSGETEFSADQEMVDTDAQTIEIDVSESSDVAEAVASENETVYLVTESTSNEILGIDPTVALAFFLGGLVVYGMFVFRRRYY